MTNTNSIAFNAKVSTPVPHCADVPDIEDVPQHNCVLFRRYYLQRGDTAQHFIVDLFTEPGLHGLTTATISREGVIVGASRCHSPTQAVDYALARARRECGGPLPSAQDLIGLLGAGAGKGQGPAADVVFSAQHSVVPANSALPWQQVLPALGADAPTLVDVEVDANVALYVPVNVALRCAYLDIVHSRTGAIPPAGTLPSALDPDLFQWLGTTGAVIAPQAAFTNDGWGASSRKSSRHFNIQWGAASTVVALCSTDSAGAGQWCVTIALRTVEKNPGPGATLGDEECFDEATDLKQFEGLPVSEAIARVKRDRFGKPVETAKANSHLEALDEQDVAWLSKRARSLYKGMARDDVRAFVLCFIAGVDWSLDNSPDPADVRAAQPPTQEAVDKREATRADEKKRKRDPEHQAWLDKRRKEDREIRKSLRKKETDRIISECANHDGPTTVDVLHRMCENFARPADWEALAQLDQESVCGKLAADIARDAPVAGSVLDELPTLLDCPHLANVPLFTLFSGYSLWRALNWNKLMHALNGNTAAAAEATSVLSSLPITESASPVPTTQPAQVKAAPTPAAITDKVLVQLAARLVHAVSREVLDIGNGSATVEQGITAYAQTIRPSASAQNDVGETSFGKWWSTFSGVISALSPDGLNRLTAQSYSGGSPAAANLHVPLVANPTVLKMATALKSGSLQDASPIIRINNDEFSGSALERAMMVDIPRGMQGLGGAFVAPLIKLLMYMNQEVPLLGPESAAAVGDTQERLQPNTRAVVPNSWFPLTGVPAVVQPAIQARVLTLSDLASLARGNLNQNMPAAFLPATWNRTTAIVPIPTSLANIPAVVAALTLARLSYPYMQVQFTSTVSKDDGSNPLPSVLRSMAAQHAIVAPVSNVIFVLTDLSRANPGFAIDVGTQAAPVQLTYAQNGPGGNPVNIGPALTQVMAAQGEWSQALGNATASWLQLYGAREDWYAALVYAADHSYVIRPGPLRTRATVARAYRSASAVGPAPTWNTAGYVDITQPALDDIALSSTHALDIGVVPLAAVQASQNRVMEIAGEDPFISSYVAAGWLSPANRVVAEDGSVPPSDIMSLTGKMRIIERLLSILGDYVFSATGLAMEEFLNMANFAGQQIRSDLMAIVSRAYAIVNAVLALVCPGITIKYRGWSLINLAKLHYTPVAQDDTIAWARVPVPMFFQAGVDVLPPQSYKLRWWGKNSIETFHDYPAAGNKAEVLNAPILTHGSEAADPARRFASLAVVSPAVRSDMQALITLKGGSQNRAFTVSWPANHPSIGRANGFALSLYQPFQIEATQFVDWPLLALPPKYSLRDGKAKNLGFYGAMFSLFTRTESTPFYAMRLVQYDPTQISEDQDTNMNTGTGALLVAGAALDAIGGVPFQV